MNEEKFHDIAEQLADEATSFLLIAKKGNACPSMIHVCKDDMSMFREVIDATIWDQAYCHKHGKQADGAPPEWHANPIRYTDAESLLAYIANNMAIEFQVNGESWDRDKAQKHFNQRKALGLVRELLCDMGEVLEGRGA